MNGATRAHLRTAADDRSLASDVPAQRSVGDVEKHLNEQTEDHPHQAIHAHWTDEVIAPVMPANPQGRTQILSGTNCHAASAAATPNMHAAT